MKSHLSFLTNDDECLVEEKYQMFINLELIFHIISLFSLIFRRLRLLNTGIRMEKCIWNAVSIEDLVIVVDGFNSSRFQIFPGKISADWLKIRFLTLLEASHSPLLPWQFCRIQHRLGPFVGPGGSHPGGCSPSFPSPFLLSPV